MANQSSKPKGGSGNRSKGLNRPENSQGSHKAESVEAKVEEATATIDAKASEVAETPNAKTGRAARDRKAARKNDSAARGDKMADGSQSTQKKTERASSSKSPAKAASSSKSSAKASAKKTEKKKGNRFIEYVKGVRTEMKRVTWPTKDELIHMSLVVLGTLVFFGLLIFAVDSGVTPLLDAFSQLRVG